MKQQPFAPIEYKEGLEADAVCGQCGSVNPEGTLICKACGNNLRDQRMLRMQADHILDGDAESSEKSPFLMRALTVLGLLILLWFGINAGRIASMLTSAEDSLSGASIAANPSQFWTGAEAGIFDDLSDYLTTNYPSPAAAQAARMESAPSETLTPGIYAVFEQVGADINYVGAANIIKDGNTCRFAARINNSIELRGQAEDMINFFHTRWEQSGAQSNGTYFAIQGKANLQTNGSLLVSGEVENNPVGYQALLYHVSR